MTVGQLANGIGSFLAMVTSGIFIIVWSLVGKWWKTPTGRFMIMKAGAICAAGVLTVSLTITGFKPNVDILRDIQAVIWVAVSVAFIHHTRMLLKLRREREKKSD